MAAAWVTLVDLVCIGVATALMANSAALAEEPPPAFLDKPQWLTSSRLLKQGESIECLK